MNDIKEALAELNPANAWDATLSQLLANAPPRRVCATDGCDGDVGHMSETLCNACERRRQRIERNEATIPATYRACRFGSPLLENLRGGPGLARNAQVALDALRSGKAPSAVIHSPAGVGKTVTAVAMLQDWQQDRPGEFVDAVSVGRCFRNAPLGSEPEAMARAKAAGLILLDDVGAEPPSGNDAVAELIHDRHATGRPTIYTCGFQHAELAKMYGTGIARRIFDRAVMVLSWPEAARKAA